MNRIFLLTVLSLCFNVSSQVPPTLTSLLGHELGAGFSRHHEVVSFYENLNAEFASQTVIQDYGQTNEGRKLFLFFMGSKDNINRLEDVRKQHLIKDTSVKIPIIWLSYNVHGNESSATEASMETAFKLLTTHKALLEDALVIIDPCLNPDGRDRYVNFFKQYESDISNSDPASIEHREPWPGGRFNHYLFDLNRDWAWLTQVESQQRIKAYNKWLPHVHVDFHEQGYNEPYYFPPAAEPFHEIITDWQREFQERIGKNHAKYFDKAGWLYFSKEIFDLLYPSYGDTYPMYNGAIGMTYEQAGSGRAGKSIRTDLGDTLTLKDRIAHHVTTGLSTVEVSLENKNELIENYNAFSLNRKYKYEHYILRGDNYRLQKLTNLLNAHDIEYAHIVKEGNIRAWSFNSQNEEQFSHESNDIVVSTNQLKGPMVEVLFEPETHLSDSLTYDITAWSLPYAYGLDAYGFNGNIEVKFKLIPTNITFPKPNCYAYVCKWNSMNSAAFLQSILAQKIAVKVARKEFQIEGEVFPVGTLVIPRGINQGVKNFDQIITSASSKAQIHIEPVASGYVSKGKDFGSSSYKEIYLPKVGVLSGGDLSPLNTGEIWHFFEKELALPFRMFRITELNGRGSIDDLDVIVLPEGEISSVQLDKLKLWIENGGRLIVFGDAAYNFTEDFDISVKEVEIDYSATEREELSSIITGAIYKCDLRSKSSSLSFGYDGYFSLRQSAANFSLKNGNTIIALPEKAEQVSGFVGYKARENQGNAMILGEEDFGRGSLVYFCDNPLFRGFWENGKLLVANALYFGNAKD
ncbi:MAG: M14 family metallopeptidase [Crocinitomicaceae bacterium]